MISRNNIITVFLITIVTISQFYYSYKFSDPGFGNSDFYQYKEMVIQPFSADSSRSPFVYRQFTTSIASLLYNVGIFYNTEISFNTDNITQRIYFALLTSNYIGLIFCFLTIIFFIKRHVKQKSVVYYFFPIFFILTSFGYLFNGLSVLTEGWTYFFNTIIFILIIERKIVLTIAFLLLSLLNKEITSIIIASISFFLLVHPLRLKKIDRYYLKVLIQSVFCFVIYLTIRLFLVPIEGGDNQTNFNEIVLNIKDFTLNFEFIKQSILSLSAIIILILLITVNKRYSEILRDKINFSIFSTIIILFIIGIMSGIGNNIGRIVSSMTPIIILTCLKYFDKEYEENLPF